MSKKRFQECNKVVQFWRYRWYLLIPFQYVWYSYLRPMKVPETAYDEELCFTTLTGEEYSPRGKNLWKLLKGMAQGKMNWYYTMEEVEKELDFNKGNEDES